MVTAETNKKEITMLKTKNMLINVTGFKSDGDNNSMTFSCYGNTKGNVDHAWDRAVDGAYVESIETHKRNGTMPKMFWMHNPHDLPIGKWTEMREDEKGLYLEGEFANTSKGRDVYELMKSGALDSFSIGYSVEEEEWNEADRCNDLIKITIKEISAVTFACNEESRLVSIKSKMEDGDLPTIRELEKFLVESGLSNRQAKKISSKYQPTQDIFELMSKVS